ncbi:hypothetical protein CISIN_1g047699mg, partial [Citrus sinensis]
MSQNGKLMPNLDQQSTKLLSLTVLQRIDPFIEEILITAAHVTFYEFNIDLSQWSRKDVEGSLFVVKRNTQPRFQFVVMNRRNTGWFVVVSISNEEYNVPNRKYLYANNIEARVFAMLLSSVKYWPFYDNQERGLVQLFRY